MRNALINRKTAETDINLSLELDGTGKSSIDTGCGFMDAEGIAEFNRIDCMHLTAKVHRMLADALAEKVKEMTGTGC